MKKALMMAVAACVMAAPAMARDDMTPAEKEAKMEKKADMWFDKVDANKDGMISKEENASFAEKMFSETDKDGNGSLSKEEMKEKKKEELKDMKEKM